MPIRPSLGLRSAALAVGAAVLAAAAHAQDDLLPSWNTGATRDAIVTFVEGVTTEGGPHFVAAEDRIAVFDNDGTLWAEQPMYVQLAFAIDRVKALAPQHPNWETTEPYASILKGDGKEAFASGKNDVAKVIAATNSGCRPRTSPRSCGTGSRRRATR